VLRAAQPVDRRQLQVVKGHRSALSAVVDVRASLGVRSFVPILRRGPLARHGTAAAEHNGFHSEPGAPRRLVRVPRSVGSIPSSHSAEVCSIGIRTVTVLRFFHRWRGRARSSFPAIPGWVRLVPRWYQASLWFVRRGSGTSWTERSPVVPVLPRHPIPPLPRARAVVTSFTVAHSVTLIARPTTWRRTRCGFALIETLIAMSIVYMALENIVGGN